MAGCHIVTEAIPVTRIEPSHLGEEVNGKGLRVLSVYLGRTASRMQAAIHKAEAKRYCPDRLIQPEDVASVILNALKLPRTAEVTDINIRSLMKPM